jgi:hypothetical protein
MESACFCAEDSGGTALRGPVSRDALTKQLKEIDNEFCWEPFRVRHHRDHHNHQHSEGGADANLLPLVFCS